ncbi:hypothetical protein H4R35_004000, partial [Dimargaris xerosporica]
DTITSTKCSRTRPWPINTHCQCHRLTSLRSFSCINKVTPRFKPCWVVWLVSCANTNSPALPHRHPRSRH